MLLIDNCRFYIAGPTFAGHCFLASNFAGLILVDVTFAKCPFASHSFSGYSFSGEQKS